MSSWNAPTASRKLRGERLSDGASRPRRLRIHEQGMARGRAPDRRCDHRGARGPRSLASQVESKGIRAWRYCDRSRPRFRSRRTKPDVVFDVVVPTARHDVAFAAFDHGCHLLTEKPMADTREHAQAIVAAGRRANRHHAVVQNRRYLAEVRRIRRFLDSGAIGAPTSIHADFFVAPHFGGFREEMDHILLLDMAIHTFDAARYMVDGEPVSVVCHEWEPKNSWWRQGSSAMAMFDMGRGIVFTYRGSWCADGFRSSWEFRMADRRRAGFARVGRLWRASRRTDHKSAGRPLRQSRAGHGSTARS